MFTIDDINQIVALARGHEWIALAALAIGLLVRLTKADVPWFPTVLARWRPWIALGLGVVAGVLGKVAAGEPWATALLGGALAALSAISGHQLLVESARGGAEVPMPGATRAAENRGCALVEALPALVVAGVVAAALSLALGCGSVPGARDVPRPVRLLVERAACAEAAQRVPEADRAAFLSACNATADIFGRAVRDAGADAP